MKRKNPKKEAFLKSIPRDTIESTVSKFRNIAFNFGFFDSSQAVGQDFKDWTHDQVLKFLDKLRSYCKNSMEHWLACPIGKGNGRVLAIYGSFPDRSGFSVPKHVPIDVRWGRFRLEYDMRVIGFVVDGGSCQKLGLSKNVFYIVFLDQNHEFYKSEEK